MTQPAWSLVLDDDPLVARTVARAMSPLGEPRPLANCAAAREALGDRRGLVAAVLDLVGVRP